ncbi:putative bifunctional UDP-N-acetylglucosamine transferase and deubiquitinase ALG13 [Adelges cooleyi]|uniref:putative bifunctional UDP-N-acetylglucosamine transferase and deubiquitinase ALG13 n=1 Tax=Adelges cooleyi TaxID=133065 RepID=UPI00217F9160|nr:putative bifunctional UDP-N-acetylglucosamine transferase and deubiquitinase ALG13 [Adelges cooleyi]XP_050430264.1 putative bifunctional UDP-N-acetylglucosamine transferase and deubiquitinase ALG13 [Adelges cooleyi]XP_050430265.1 putative bifunctional UDP-N-acetylglucosamine transferase and deubiquitinase ALG13 [Adelges cooleyi]
MLTLSVRNRSKSKRAPTPKIDEQLERIGLMRHVVPRDGNSLFRCISQCVFLTQSCHMVVRQHLLEFSRLQAIEFGKMTQLPAAMYAKKITDTKLDGELLDMRVAAKVYRINITFYVDAHPFIPLVVDIPDAVKTLNICLNYEGTYDLVLVKESVENISFCQAVVYEMLYKNVFMLAGVDFAVKEMLFERNLPSSRSNDRLSLEKRATCTDMKELLEIGITPFPFKVAKALTPKLYRNTEYDIWLNSKKEKFYGRWNNWEFKEGSKCLVSIDDHEYDCYIQRIREKNEPVEVYVKDLARKIDVEFDQLRLMPVEQDVRDLTADGGSPPVQVGQVSSSTPDEPGKATGHSDEKQELSHRVDVSAEYHRRDTPRPRRQQTTPEMCTMPTQLSGHAVHPPPNYYVRHYPPPPLPQMPALPLTTLNSSCGNMVQHPWYMPTPPPALPPFKERFVLVEQPPLAGNINRHIVSPPNFQFVNFVEGLPPPPPPPHFQQLSPSWYCVTEHQTAGTTCKCEQCDNSNESVTASTMDFNRAYHHQPWPQEYDASTSDHPASHLNSKD